MVCCWNFHWSRLDWQAQWKWQSRTRPRVATFFQLFLVIPTSSNHAAAVAPASHTHQNVCSWVSPVILRLHWSQGKSRCIVGYVCCMTTHCVERRIGSFVRDFLVKKKFSLFVASSSSPTKDSEAVKSWWCLQ